VTFQRPCLPTACLSTTHEIWCGHCICQVRCFSALIARFASSLSLSVLALFFCHVGLMKRSSLRLTGLTHSLAMNRTTSVYAAGRLDLCGAKVYTKCQSPTRFLVSRWQNTNGSSAVKLRGNLNDFLLKPIIITITIS